MKLGTEFSGDSSWLCSSEWCLGSLARRSEALPTFPKAKGDASTLETQWSITNLGYTESRCYCAYPFKMVHTHAWQAQHICPYGAGFIVHVRSHEHGKFCSFPLFRLHSPPKAAGSNHCGLERSCRPWWPCRPRTDDKSLSCPRALLAAFAAHAQCS